MNLRSVMGLVGWLLLVAAVAVFGSQFTPGDWYAGLEKPAWNPPSWVFGPVWTLLYIMIAVAAWRVWAKAGWRRAPAALGIFLLQLALNGAWSWLFFGLHEITLALVDIIALWLAIVATILLFRRHDTLATWLLVPYLAWVSFATCLTAWHFLVNG